MVIIPKTTTKEAVNIKAFRGRPSFLFTFANTLENGRPRSLAKANVIRLDVVIIEVVAKSKQTSGKISRHVAPARLFVAVY